MMQYIIRIKILLIFGLISLSKPVFSQEIILLTQTIRGQVVDKESQTTLSGANIVILNTMPLKATITDAYGYFRIENVPVGRNNIQISYLGYKLYTISEIQVTASKEVVLKVQLQEDAFSLDAVTVKAYKDKTGTINSMATISARTFSAEETRRYAGGMDDPARMASAFAGVAVG
ncbi:MAG: carboxypeptidase-like regulatory domain-containing protein, partial [Bacteroidales bacterium]|nr:carboxypeptidase-like regulatory domain-containing protein [Bacteroidales bacterium]